MRERVSESERAIQSPHTTRGNNNELIMLQVKAKKGADEVEVGKTAVAAAAAAAATHKPRRA